MAPRRRARRSAPAAIAIVTALTLAGLAGCGGGDEDTGSPDLPDGAVAVVGDEEITAGELREQVAVLRRSQPKPGAGGGGGGGGEQATKQLEHQALSTLLLTAALEQEAAERDIVVTSAELRRRFDAAARTQFPTARARRRFLDGQTEHELIDQLRLQLLTDRIHSDVAEQAGGGKRGAEAVARFQEELRERWSERTACREGNVAGLCSKPG